MPESALSPIVDEIMRRNGMVCVKSHSRGTEETRRVPIELHFQVIESSEKIAEARLRQAVEMTKRKLRGKGVIWDIGRT